MARDMQAESASVAPLGLDDLGADVLARWSGWVAGFSGHCDIGTLAHASRVREREEDLSVLHRVKGRYVDALIEDGWIPFHAGAVRIGGGVLLFPGGCGTGKSTFAVNMALAGHEAADDLVLVRLEGGAPVTLVPPLPLSLTDWAMARSEFPGDWAVTETCSRPEKSLVLPSSPLRGRFETTGILILCATSDELRATKIDTAKRLMTSMPRARDAGGFRARAWQVLSTLVDRVPAYNVAREGDASVVRGAEWSRP